MFSFGFFVCFFFCVLRFAFTCELRDDVYAEVLPPQDLIPEWQCAQTSVQSPQLLNLYEKFSPKSFLASFCISCTSYVILLSAY